jgi:Asp-tRNA(Asn)/Glu-tRNA(Gln) amidotransferase C subunit
MKEIIQFVEDNRGKFVTDEACNAFKAELSAMADKYISKEEVGMAIDECEQILGYFTVLNKSAKTASDPTYITTVEHVVRVSELKSKLGIKEIVK